MILIKNTEVFAPALLGKKDVLLAGDKIYKIADEITIDSDLCKIIDGTGKKLVPGFIDSHVHICGGGGEGGFKTRTPEIQLSNLIGAGVTTVIGVLGTDGTTRTMSNLIAKTKSLKEEGVSAYCLTGSYQVPVRTLTGSITDDIILIEEIIGCGEIAIADHRSSHPSLDELKKLASDTRLGGILSGKAGIINIHMGDSKKMLEEIYLLLENSAIPVKQFVPTHMNRNPYLFEAGIEYIKKGGYIDYTTSTTPEFLADGEEASYTALRKVIEAVGNCDNVTFSSDGQGSLPEFDKEGNLLRLKIGSCETLFDAVRTAVKSEGVPLEEALKVITSNPAKIYKLNKGKIEENRDADLVLLDEELNIHSVIAKGKAVMENYQFLIKGTFEN